MVANNAEMGRCVVKLQYITEASMIVGSVSQLLYVTPAVE
jgi:hypothetical protein